MARINGTPRPKNLKKTLKAMASYLTRHIGTLIIIAILVLISAGANILGTYLLKPVINDYILPGNNAGLLQAIITMAIMYLTGVGACHLYNQLMEKTAQEIVKEIREDLFDKIQNLPLSFFDQRTHGELMSRFTSDIDTILEALNNSFAMLIQSFIMIVGTITMIIILNPYLSIIVIASMVMMFIFIRYSSKKSKQYFNQQQKYMGSLNGFIEEMVEGSKVVKVFNHEQVNFAEFEKRNQALRQAATKAVTYSGTMIPTVVSISYLNYALSAVIGGFMAIYGIMDLGSLSSYLVFVRQTAMPVNQFSQQMNFILAAMSGAERIFEIMDEKVEIDEGSVTLTNVRNEYGKLVECHENTGLWAWRHPRSNGDVELVLLKGDVRFHDVCFSYVSNHPILKNLNLYAKPGQKIAFVGSTGAGKTTITNLINRFYELDSGSITYDGIDIKLIKKAALRQSLSMVLQDTHLFTGTIEDNIRYGKLDASDEEVVAAAKLANADSFIRRLPQGYQTMLTGDGSNLSQGQRQLLAIARAAIANPPVLILDEATSSIDTHTEKLIEKGMDSLMKDRTVFVIAHRLSTVRNSKAIMVLDHGEIIERGNHDELINQKGRYYQLYTGKMELS